MKPECSLGRRRRVRPLARCRHRPWDLRSALEGARGLPHRQSPALWVLAVVSVAPQRHSSALPPGPLCLLPPCRDSPETPPGQSRTPRCACRVRLQMCSTNGLKIRLAIYYEFAWCMADLGAIGDARNLMLVKVWPRSTCQPPQCRSTGDAPSPSHVTALAAVAGSHTSSPLRFLQVLTVLKAHKVRLSGRQEVSLAPAEHTATGVPLSSLGLPWSTQFGPTAPFYAR